MKKYKAESVAISTFFLLLGLLIVWLASHSAIALLGTIVASMHFDFDDIYEQLQKGKKV